MPSIPKSNAYWSDRDLAVVWHPCTQMRDHESYPPIPIKRGEGVWLEDYEGRRYLDAISSWWVNLFGHNHPYISAALKDQLDTLEQVILAGFTHAPAIHLAERLLAKAPAGLSRCFYADNGSSAVEVALKMSFHYWQNKGKTQKTRFITLANSYHGETLGALSVSDVALYRDTYAPLLLTPITVASPDCFHCEPGESWAEYSTRLFEPMREVLNRYADEVCAVIVEPLVQCAGGMRMYDPIYLELLRKACDEHGVHLIADEIAVGFGRTGTFLASEQAHIRPDFICLSKGLTGGYLPLSCVLTTETVYAAFYAEYSQLKAFLHSHSYTGNALACRAALATLDLFESEDTLAKNKVLANRMRTASRQLEDHPHLSAVRQTGMILAVDMLADKNAKKPYPWQERRGFEVCQQALARGVLLRPLGNVVYFMPPYVITPEEIDRMIEVAVEAINLVTRC